MVDTMQCDRHVTATHQSSCDVTCDNYTHQTNRQIKTHLSVDGVWWRMEGQGKSWPNIVDKNVAVMNAHPPICHDYLFITKRPIILVYKLYYSYLQFIISRNKENNWTVINGVNCLQLLFNVKLAGEFQ